MRNAKRFPATDPREWINRARSDLSAAHTLRATTSVYLEDACFHAQQAAEKAIKAILVSRQVRFRWIHDLAELLDLVRQSGVVVAEDIAACIDLTEYSGGGRYPGRDEPVNEEESDEAIRLAEAVVKWAEGIVPAEQDQQGAPADGEG